jgi:hypothetical protein
MKGYQDRLSVLIFDWDDTICPSSFLEHRKIETFYDLPKHVSGERICLDGFMSLLRNIDLRGYGDCLFHYKWSNLF